MVIVNHEIVLLQSLTSVKSRIKHIPKSVRVCTQPWKRWEPQKIFSCALCKPPWRPAVL